MVKKILAATSQGVFLLQPGQDGWLLENTWMEKNKFTSIAVSGSGSILAGSKDGLFLSTDAGETWKESNAGLTQAHIRSVDFHPENPGLAFAGTEPAAVFYSVDGGMNWKECLEVARLREERHWYLPYSPGAGCIREFAFSGREGLAAVEVGGMLKTHDFGKNWQLTQDQNDLTPSQGRIHADVHSVFIHPQSSNHVFAPTGGGLFESLDGGENWGVTHPDYCRAIWVDPEDSQHQILGPADGPDRGGRIERTKDGGKTWEDLSAGLQTPWANTMVEHFTPAEGALLAVLSNGSLVQTSLADIRWQSTLTEDHRARQIAVL